MTTIRNVHIETLSQSWSKLERYTYEFQLPDGSWEKHVRESYNRGDGVTVLLINREKQKILLTRQFRLPTYVNGNPDGMLIETCAGKLGKNENAETGILREIEEETGHQLQEVKKLFEIYMSPGSVTEIIHFYLGEYCEKTKVSDGGGLSEEQENIETIELSLPEALQMIQTGEIKDGKTIILLQHAALHKIFS
jgi:nudix-type nucleoside diphosphatase (YffH/AdpP family)